MAVKAPFYLLLLALTLVACPFALAQNHRTRSHTKPILVARINSSGIIGSIGRPLGEVVTVEGTAVDDSYTRRKEDAGEILLRIQSVNGKRLKSEAVLHFVAYNGEESKKPSVGTKFKYIGFETGGFSGMPESAFVYIPRVPTSGYYFTTSFVILRDDSGGK